MCQRVGGSVYRCVSVSVCQCVSVLVGQCIGALVYRCAGGKPVLGVSPESAFCSPLASCTAAWTRVDCLLSSDTSRTSSNGFFVMLPVAARFVTKVYIYLYI